MRSTHIFGFAAFAVAATLVTGFALNAIAGTQTASAGAPEKSERAWNPAWVDEHACEVAPLSALACPADEEQAAAETSAASTEQTEDGEDVKIKDSFNEDNDKKVKDSFNEDNDKAKDSYNEKKVKDSFNEDNDVAKGSYNEHDESCEVESGESYPAWGTTSTQDGGGYDTQPTQSCHNKIHVDDSSCSIEETQAEPERKEQKTMLSQPYEDGYGSESGTEQKCHNTDIDEDNDTCKAKQHGDVNGTAGDDQEVEQEQYCNNTDSFNEDNDSETHTQNCSANGTIAMNQCSDHGDPSQTQTLSDPTVRSLTDGTSGLTRLLAPPS
jgi:hypothetical protein